MELKNYAYYATGGSCRVLHEPKSIDELSIIVKKLFADKTPYFVLGGGTNSLVLDNPFPGDVIIFSHMKTIRREGFHLVCGAGADNTEVSVAALNAGLTGISWMNRLPGQIGATVRMNARCYGGEISQVASSVRAVLPDGSIKHYTSADGIFRGYKDTLFMANGAIIAEATLSLTPGDPALIKTHMDYCMNDRIAKGQFDYPTCGCVFKNNYQVGVPSGMLLDRADAKRLNTPVVALNPQHSNFVYNKGTGSDDILRFTLAMQELVYQEFGVWMEYEMEILGQLTPEQVRRVREIRPSRMRDDKLNPLRETFKRNDNKMKPET
ncbi:MAG: FAD-binding protein [Bdellovibrionota bacterium]